MKTTVEVYTCECGCNIIVLDENFEDAVVDIEDVTCPSCYREMVSQCTRQIEISTPHK